jgi:hypothetical protein
VRQLAATTALLGACTTQLYTVPPRRLIDHHRELREHGHARVPVDPEGTREIAMEDRFTVRFERERAWGLYTDEHERTLTVRELLAGCPDAQPFRGHEHTRCPAIDTVTTRLVVDQARRVDWPLVGKVLLAPLGLVPIVLIMAALSWMDDECREPGKNCQ